MSLVVRAAGSPDALVPALRRAVLAAEPDLAGVAGSGGFTPVAQGLSQYLAGRHQKDVPPDVAAKLKDITVDPKTVSGAVSLKGALAPPGN